MSDSSLAFQIESLTKRIRPLQQQSDRIALVRLFIVIAGIGATLVTAVVLSGIYTWIVLGISLVVFLIVVVLHRRLERWIETLTLWRALKQDRRARLALDWDELPPPRPIELKDRSLAFDLDLTGQRSLHQLLDTTISRAGTQLLAEWLTTKSPDLAAMTRRQKIVSELRSRDRFRDRFRLTYRLVLKRELEGDNLLEWLKTEFPSARLRWTLPVATVLVAINLILFVLWQFYSYPPYFIASLVAYVAFYYWNQKALESVLGAVVRVNAELEKFRAIVRYLETASYRNAPHLAELCAPFLNKTPAPSQQLRNVWYITAGVGLRNNPLLSVLLNLILPWDFLFAFLADRQRAQVAQSLPEWVRVVQELDGLIALGNFAALNPCATFPEIQPGMTPVLSALSLGHPLIPAASRVTNDIEIKSPGEVEILTGSNMAGKSTFLKTLGVNFCLAYAGAPVLATKFVAQPFRLHACIRITDSIVDGFSYFYAEVKCLQALLQELKRPDPLPLFYMIDEIFRGTNNRERLIGSRAYIQALLGANGAGLIATHDLELAHLADHNALAFNYHFRDDVEDGRLVFDYRLRPGPCPTTNALRIMAMEGLPVEPSARS
jgi:ABC-type multidrug transport system fused ATPase/permease subunit